ncbi:hypothetical protein ACS0TY_035564 [Phlomoides rotata]
MTKCRPTFLTIHKEKSVLQFKSDPYVITIFNCMLWMLYGMPFVHPDSLLVITINGAGVVIEAIYITIFFIYSDSAKRRKLSLTLAMEALAMLIVTIITLVFLHGTKSRSAFVGILCIIMNIAMYGSPLTVMSRVIKTKSVKYMPLPLSLANLANGIVWSIYALIKFDPFILIPNGLGCFSGVLQLVLYGTYYKTTNWEEDDNNHSDIELQDPARA